MGTVSALSGLLAGAPLLEAAPPSWVTAFPRDADRYIGIGCGNKLLHPTRFREMAQEAALAQISREISVRLHAETRSAQNEDRDGWREAYRQTVTAVSNNDLAGYEREDVYETQEEFWVLYALDKERFRSILEGKVEELLAWMSREEAAVDAALAGRRFQAAVDRYANLRKRYEADYAGDALLRRQFPEPAARFAGLSSRVLAATRDLALESEAGTWVLDWVSVPSAVPIALKDGHTGADGSGPLRLLISETRIPGGPECRVETDGQGRLNPAEVTLKCGLGPGIWRVTWMGPEGKAFSMQRKVSVRKGDLAVNLQAGKTGIGTGKGAQGEVNPEAEALISLLRDELALLEVPWYNLVFASPAKPASLVLDIRILEASRDTLEGMQFTTLRGKVRFPDGVETYEIVGKSGHGDPERSRRKAVRDFAQQVEARLKPGPLKDSHHSNR